MNRQIYKYIIAVTVLLCSCAEKGLEPISKSLGKPNVVTEINVQTTPGGAIITYKTPEDNDILGVKAVYTLTNGQKNSRLVSFYDNELIIEGYNDEELHDIELYTFNRAQEMSDPVVVTIKPKKSNLKIVSESMTITPDFGGPKFEWENPNKALIVIEFYVPDKLGVFNLSKVLATEALALSHTIRGYKVEELKVAAIIKDKFNNVSDTIYPAGGNTILPLYEEVFAKTVMNVMALTNDASYNMHGGKDSYMIDDDIETIGHSDNGNMPGSLTIDLGKVVKMSRFVIHNRLYWGHAFAWGNIKDFEVYTRVDAPSQSGDWSEWTLLMKNAVKKPSGLAGTEVLPEDIAFGTAFEFVVPLSQVPFRYFRLKILNTWSNTTFAHPAEFDFFGQIPEQN